MNNKIRVLIVEPNKEPKQVKIEHNLRKLQEIVGGRIDIIELDHNTDIIINDDGKINGLALNRVIPNDIIAGTFIVAGQHLGETISLSRKQIKKYKKRFKLSNDNDAIEFVKAIVGDSEKLLYCNMAGIGKVIKFRV